MLIKANGPLKIRIAADMLIHIKLTKKTRTNKKEKENVVTN